MKFREHRGGLKESMETMVELKDRAALLEYCIKALGDFRFSFPPEALHIKPYSYDDRIDWDTHIVSIDGYGVVGFTDGPVNE